MERVLVQLAGLGAGALVVGGALARRGRTPGARAFGQQTAGWGAIDLAIAGVGALRPPPEPERLRKVLRINAGLDLGYVAAGAHIAFWRNTFGNRVTPEEARGHGLAIVVQGAALFVLDSYWASRRATRRLPAVRR